MSHLYDYFSNMSLLYDHHPANITILYYHEFPAAFITATILISPCNGPLKMVLKCFITQCHWNKI